jgi:hypothetical protein
MSIGPTELMIIGAVCCIPIALAAVVAVVVLLIRSSKDNLNNG